MPLGNESMSHSQPNPDEANDNGPISAGQGPGQAPMFQGPYEGFHSSQGNPSVNHGLMHPQANPPNQGSHWPNPYDVIPPETSGNVGQLGNNPDNKMVYHSHHVHHMMPHTQPSAQHGWYGHQGGQMMNNHFIHDPHQQPDSMMMMGYHHGHQDLNKNPNYMMPPPQQQQQQIIQQPQQQHIPLPQAQPNVPAQHQHPIKSEIQSVSKKPAHPPKKQPQRAKRQQKQKPVNKKIKSGTKTEENWNISVDDVDNSEDDDDDDDDEDDLIDSDEDDVELENKNSTGVKTKNRNGPEFAKVTGKKSPKKSADKVKKSTDISKLDDNAKEVAIRFKSGCECQDQNCFEGLDPENVSRHRLNIAELSKLEHDMYLMGVTVASIENTEENHRQKERKRLRAKYRFMGKEVCLSAFLYLDNTTLHQLKSIRKHVKFHGVTPRIHGNHRKKPHNTFSLDIYQYATRFLQSYFEIHSAKDVGRKKGLIYLSSGMTCKKIHSEYIDYCRIHIPDSKTMGYSTFRHFIKEQFPNLRFQKEENSSNASNRIDSLEHPRQKNSKAESQAITFMC